MIKVEPTTFIQYGDLSFEVAKMSIDNKRMVAVLDAARQREEDALSTLTEARATIRGVQTAFAEAIQAAQNAVADKAMDEPAGE